MLTKASIRLAPCPPPPPPAVVPVEEQGISGCKQTKQGGVGGGGGGGGGGRASLAAKKPKKGGVGGGGEGGGCSQPLLAAVSPSVPISWRHDAWMRGTSAIHRKIRAGSLYRKSHCGSQDVLYVCIPASSSMHSSSTTVVCIVGSSCSAISSCPVLSCPSVPDRATYRPKSYSTLVRGGGRPGAGNKPPRGWW